VVGKERGASNAERKKGSTEPLSENAQTGGRLICQEETIKYGSFTREKNL